jgi:hypothetical protein
MQRRQRAGATRWKPEMAELPCSMERRTWIAGSAVHPARTFGAIELPHEHLRRRRLLQ